MTAENIEMKERFATISEVILLLQKNVNLSKIDYKTYNKPFHDGGCYHTETSPLICRANQWTGFYMITASVMKGLNQ